MTDPFQHKTESKQRERKRLAALPFDLLSVKKRDACRAKLLAARDRLERDEQEAGYD